MRGFFASTNASAEPAALAVTLGEDGRKATVEVGESTEAGPTEITATNEGKREHSAQLIRVDEGHTVQEGLAAASKWAETGKSALPEWVHLAVPVPPAELEVTGEATGEAPTAPAKLEAKEYGFTGSGLESGATTLQFENTGEQPHHAEALAIAGDATIEDVKKFLRTEKGKPPIDESKRFGTAVIDGGGSQTVDLELEPGRYAVLCFVPDREGGPPHAFKGMVSEIEVK